MSGVFITFEGTEGCGKSTQVHLLTRHLESDGHEVVVTREPGGTPIAEAIRDLLLDPANEAMAPTAELLLYEAARAQHVQEKIRPALDEGKIVICDRFYDSTTAYQGAGRKLPEIDIESLHELATQGLTPDLTIFLDLPVEEGLRRAKSAGPADRIENEALEFHERVYAGFIQLAEKYPARIKRIDATRSPEAIAFDLSALADALVESQRPDTP